MANLPQCLLLFLVLYCSSASHAQSDSAYTFLSTNTTWSISNPETLVGSLTLENENNASAYLITHIVHQSFPPQINAWSFLTLVQSGENEYYLAVVVSGSIIQSKGEVVWTANYYQPVSSNAVLELQSDGNLVLYDIISTTTMRRSVIWSTQTTGMGVKGIRLFGGGAVELLGEDNNTAVWRNIDYPTDTLLLGQLLRVGDTLHSRSSPFNLSRGSYTLIVKPGGLGLYVNASINDSPELYWMWKVYNNNGSTLDDPGQQCSNGNSSTFTVSIGWPDSEFGLKFQNSTCKGSSFGTHYYPQPIQTGQNLSSTDFVLVRVDYDGNLRAYASGRGEALYQAMSKCQLPSSCGNYGVCTEEETCESATNGTHQVGHGLSVNYPTCANVNGTWQMFALAGVEYYRNRYAAPLNMSTKEDCSEYCFKNCSCKSSFYLAESNSCFVVSSQVGTLSQTSNANHFAFIKLQSTDLVENSLKHSSNKKTVIWIVVTVCAAMLCLLCFYPCKACRNSKPDQLFAASGLEDHSEHRVMSSIPDLIARKFSFKEIQAITRNFHKVLGSGGFGTVYEGVLVLDGTKVAVKKLEIARQGEKEFYSEVAILGIIHHWNLVQLLGFCAQKSHKILVYEHVANGSLDQWLFNDYKIKFLTWPVRFNIILGTARGLAYLHEECRYKIVHLDVKPQNILLDENFVAKVSDFGMATLMSRNDSRVVTSMRGTPGYLAPEWLLQAAITDKSDVYSFGMVLLEIIGGRKNYNIRLVESEKHYFPAWAMSMASSGREEEIIDSRLEDEIERKQAVRVLKIGFLCIQEDAHKRPSMGAIVQLLEGEKEVPECPNLRQSFQFAIANNINPTTASTDSLPSNNISSSSSTHFVLSR